MKKIGLDFGTTNSTLCFYDPDQKNFDFYRMHSAGGPTYIPSFVRYEKEDGSVEIGKQAKTKQNDDDYSVFSGFKMLLGESKKERLEKYGFDSKTPDECAKSYIKKLFENYCNERNIPLEKIEDLVITVPEIWIKEHRHASREHLKKIINDLKLPLKKLISEPVAASAYFVHSYNKKYNSWFNGYLMLCDYGGGTLDLSLSNVEGEKITVLECAGKGHDNELLGKAGVAFDREVVTQVYEREKGEKLSRKNKKYYDLLDKFEEEKIHNQSDIEKRLEKYLKNKAVDKKVFLVDDLKFMASDLVNAFEKIIKPDLLNALNEMMGYIKKSNINYTDPEQFRIVMAGGFSSFYLVQKTIKDFFGSKASSDKRFDSCFDIEETALAIAKGAALIANNMVSIDLTCPISVGLRLKTDAGCGFLEDKDIAILQKGEKLSKYQQSVFLKGGISVSIDPSMRKTPIIIFLGDDDKRRYIRLDKGLNQLFKGTNIKGNKWKVGFSVNENFLFTLHTQDKNGNKQETPLGDLLEKVSGLIYNEEDKI